LRVWVGRLREWLEGDLVAEAVRVVGWRAGGVLGVAFGDDGGSLFAVKLAGVEHVPGAVRISWAIAMIAVGLRCVDDGDHRPGARSFRKSPAGNNDASTAVITTCV